MSTPTLEREERTGDLVAHVNSYEVRVRAPAPGGDWFSIRLDGQGLLSVRTVAEAESRARLLVQALDTATPLRNRVAREEVVARVDLVEGRRR